ncbi:MAG: hypothetical protein SGJ27_30670 [Candidatus Melainabacteria bacterium]|nr:hypothetical protein [Candidatus Melainabacteria bacterium]
MSKPERIKFTLIDILAMVIPYIAYVVFIHFVPEGREYRLSLIATSFGWAVLILVLYKLSSALKMSQTVVIRLAPITGVSAAVAAYLILRAVLPPFEPDFERNLTVLASGALLALLLFFVITRGRSKPE